jgi:hypothetical protein
VTVDHVCDLYRTVPDLMKIDVEGAETEVLRGSKHCASHAKRRFLVEMHSPPELPMVANAAKVLAWCEEVGSQRGIWQMQDVWKSRSRWDTARAVMSCCSRRPGPTRTG